MTEAEWRAGDDPQRMLEALVHKASTRKLRLFLCASVREVWHLLRDERSLRAVESAERYGDGLLGAEELQEAGYAAQQAAWEAPNLSLWALYYAAHGCT